MEDTENYAIVGDASLKHQQWLNTNSILTENTEEQRKYKEDMELDVMKITR